MIGAFIGTSGWHYEHWRGVFYPPDLRPEDYLAFYARHFSTVEVNNTFYQLPTARTVSNWAAATPAGFILALKASQYITHRKRLKDPEKTLGRFMEIAALLGEKAGPLLFQLPPRFKVNLSRLEAFLGALPRGGRYAFEFRDHSWFVPEVREALIRHNAGFCLYDQAGLVTPIWITAPFVYVVVAADLSLRKHPDVFVAGDAAATWAVNGTVYPQLAPVAVQQAKHVARQLDRRLKGIEGEAFDYVDRGTMSTIGRNAAIAELPLGLRFHGYPAWTMWLGLHLIELIGFRNRTNVLLDWGWNYLTHHQGAGLMQCEGMR